MNKLKVGVIGAGRIGRNHIGTIVNRIPNAEVDIVADAFIKSARDTANDFGIHKYTDNYKDIFNSKDITAVLICSPTDTHSKYIVEAAEAGKHIFCEKPVDHSIERIQSSIISVNKAGVKLMVGFNRRFDPNFRKIKEIILSDSIGEPHILKITSYDPAPPPIEYIKNSGGMFVDMTIHDFDMARFLMGCEVDEVTAKGTVLVDQDIGNAGDIDTAIITMKFKNGALGVILNSRKAVYGYDQRVEVLGSRGMVNVDNNYPDTHRCYTREKIESSVPLNFFMERYTDAYVNEIRSFIDSIIQDKESEITGYDGLMAVVVSKAADISLSENRTVKISEIL